MNQQIIIVIDYNNVRLYIFNDFIIKQQTINQYMNVMKQQMISLSEQLISQNKQIKNILSYFDTKNIQNTNYQSHVSIYDKDKRKKTGTNIQQLMVTQKVGKEDGCISIQTSHSKQQNYEISNQILSPKYGTIKKISLTKYRNQNVGKRNKEIKNEQKLYCSRKKKISIHQRENYSLRRTQSIQNSLKSSKIKYIKISKPMIPKPIHRHSSCMLLTPNNSIQVWKKNHQKPHLVSLKNSKQKNKDNSRTKFDMPLNQINLTLKIKGKFGKGIACKQKKRLKL